MSLIYIARPEMVPASARQLPSAPFIVGVPRTGTTLLRMMLDAHPELSIPAETDFLADLIPALQTSSFPAELFLARISGDPRWNDHQLDPLAFRQRILAIQPFDIGTAVRTFYWLCGERFGKKRFGDKTPGYRNFMPLIQSVLPEARFIHILRDGRDVLLSHKHTWWAPNTLADAANLWTNEIHKARAATDQLAYYMELRYEDLLRDTEGHLRKICAFLDMPWDERMLQYYDWSERRLLEFSDCVRPDGKFISADQWRGLHERTKQPPDVSRSGRWKQEMPESEQRQFEGVAGEMLEELGYERCFAEGDAKERVKNSLPNFTSPSAATSPLPRYSGGEGSGVRGREAASVENPQYIATDAGSPPSPPTPLPRSTGGEGSRRQLPPAPFIVGVGRSGTTLLRMMLDSHPALSIPAETDFVPDVVKGCPTAAHPAEFFLSRVIGDRRWKDHQLDADTLRERVLAIQPFDLSEAIRVFYRMCAERFGKERFGDKTPSYCAVQPLIQEAVPEARFIHIVRDGRDVALSLKQTWWGPKSLADAADRWAAFLQKARADVEKLSYYLEIRYEDLLSDTEATLRKICQFIDLPWDAAMLEYQERAGERLAEFRDSVLPDGQVVSADQRRDLHVLTTKPPDPSRAGRWKTEMSDEEQRQYEEHAGHWLDTFGYERRFAETPAVKLEPVNERPAPVTTLLTISQPELVSASARDLLPAPFIVGVPRSGTTLLRMMLDAHPLMSIPSETDFLPEVIAGCHTAADPAAFFLGRVIGDNRWSDHHLDADVLRARIAAIEPFDVGQAIRAFYQLAGERFGKPRFGDKTPGYVLYMPQLQEALPEAHFIHIIRDGRDTALSVKPTWWGPKTIDDAAGRWIRHLKTARADCPQLAHYMEIRYEDLLQDTEAILRKVCEFIQLPWDDCMLKYHETSARRLAELTDSVRPDGQFIPAERWRDIHALTTRPPDASRAARWKTEMPEAEQREYEALAGEWLGYFGYERRFAEGPNTTAELKQRAQFDCSRIRKNAGEASDTRILANAATEECCGIAHADSAPPSSVPVKEETVQPVAATAPPPLVHKKRLLFASYHCYVDPSSGAAQSARDLMPLLATRGWTCRVFCGPHLDFEDGRPFRQVMNSPTFGLGAGPVVADRPCTGAAVPCSLVDFAQGDIPITVFDAPRTKSLQSPEHDEGCVFMAYFERLLDEYRPDMMLTYGGHWLAQEMMLAAHRRGIPIVFWLHNCFYHTGEFFKPMAGVIVPSQFARQHYLAKLKLDFTELPPPLDWPGRVCDKVEGKYVTLVNPQPDKGVFVFAAIAQELHRRRPDIPFLVVEGRSKLSWLRDAGLDLDKLGNVFGMGATTDPRTFYRVSKMVLMPSLWDETFGRVASEALANGIPVLASRRGGLPEALAEAGFLFDVPARYTPQTRLVPSATEIAPWVDTIVRLWDDQAFYEQEQQRCRTAANVWAPEHVAKTYDDYLTNLLNQARQRAVTAASARPLVSVVMPVHNGTSYLERAVRSVQQQSFPLWELLAVDDCSTDGSHEMLTRLAGEDARIRVFRLPENRGPSAARNHALSQARGDMICYLDCDDEYYPIHLERVWSRHSEADVLMCPYDISNEKIGSPEFGTTINYDPRPFRNDLLQKRGNMIVGLGVAHRRALLERTGTFNEGLSFEEDWDLWKRFVDAGATFSFVDHRSGLYHARNESLSRTRRLPDRRTPIESLAAADNVVVTTTAPVFLLSAGEPGGAAAVEKLLLSTEQVFLWGEQRGILADNLLRIVEEMRGLLSQPMSGYREKSLENGYTPTHPDLAAIHEGCREFLERSLGMTARARGFSRWGMKESGLGRDAVLFLQELFPDARFLLVVRDPAASLQAIKGHPSYGRDFAEDPAMVLAAWAKSSQELVGLKDDLRHALLLRCEDFEANPLEAVQAIAEVTGISVKLFDFKISGERLPDAPPLEDADWQALRDVSVQAIAEKLGYEMKEAMLASP